MTDTTKGTPAPIEAKARLELFALTGDTRQWEGPEPSLDATGVHEEFRADLRALIARCEQAERSLLELRDNYNAKSRFAMECAKESDTLRAALTDMLAAASGGAKSCGHEFTCICVTDAARAALEATKGTER